MRTLATNELIENLNWRYAVKKFDPARKVAPETWAAIEQSINLSPSSYGIQPSRFVVVNDPGVRAKLRTVSWNQSQVTDASHLVVFCRKINVTAADIEAYINRIIEVRKTPVETLADYKKMMVGSVANPAGLPGGSMETWTRSQTYIALGFFLAACAMLGVDACPMEGFDPAKVDEILGLSKEGYLPVAFGAAGYRASDDWLATLPKVRAKHTDIIKHI